MVFRLNIPPLDNILIEQARRLLPIRNDGAFQAFMELCRDIGNKDNPDYQNLLGLVYKQPTHSMYDPVKAHGHFMRSANKGWGGAAYNLARGWEDGIFGAVDVERAAAWYKKGYELGHGGAGAGLFGIMEVDPRYEADDFRTTAMDILWKSAIDLKSPAASFKLATILCDRSLGSVNFETTKAVYESLAGDGTQHLMLPSSTAAALSLALRYYLGLELARDPRKAGTYARQIIAADTSLSVAAGARAENEAKRLLFLIEKEVHDPSALEIVKTTYEHPAAVDKIVARLLMGDIKASSALSNYLWAAVTLAGMENHSHKGLRVLRALIEHQLLRVTSDQLIASTEDFGPLFNKRNQHGYPLPGVMLDKPEFQDGVGDLLAIVATEGEVQFRFRAPNPATGPLLTPEDIDVALCLAFSEERAIWPAFTIDPLEPMTPNRPRYDARVKIWKPSWLANTLLGKTMYAADYWMGRVVENSRRFEDPSNPPAAHALLRRIALCGGKQAGLSGRIMLHPATFHRTWNRIQDGWQCDVHKMDMAVLGADMVLRPDGTEDWNVNKNDTRFATGRAAAMVTKEYSALCELFPLFERARQLTALVYALNGLREKGFLPSPALRQRIEKSMATILGRPQPPQQQRLIVTLEA